MISFIAYVLYVGTLLIISFYALETKDGNTMVQFVQSVVILFIFAGIPSLLAFLMGMFHQKKKNSQGGNNEQ